MISIKASGMLYCKHLCTGYYFLNKHSSCRIIHIVTSNKHLREFSTISYSRRRSKSTFLLVISEPHSYLMGCVLMKQKRVFLDPTLLSSQTRFTVEEVKSLNELFTKLGSAILDDGFMTREEFKLGLFGDSKRQSRIADRMFDLFDYKHDGVVDFEEFVGSLNIFHPDTPQEEKAIFAFKLYDIWETGFIEKGEVKEIIIELLNESDLILTDDFIEVIVDKTFGEADSDKDGKIDIEEWKNLVVQKPSLLKNMTVPYLKGLQYVIL